MSYCVVFFSASQLPCRTSLANPCSIQRSRLNWRINLLRRDFIKTTASLVAASALPHPVAASGPSKATVKNPLFAGDYSDPTILRVGEDFYMTHTSYSYAPG
jgi:hypothetical protein